MMTRNQLVMDSSAREVDVVAAHAHHLLLVGHRVRWEGDLNHFSAEEERTHELSLRTQHLHAPTFTRELGYSYQITVFDKLDRLEREIANHLGLLAWFDVQVLDVFERLVPIVAITECAR